VSHRATRPRRAWTTRRLDAAEAGAALPALVALAVRSKAAWGYDGAFMARFEALMARTSVEVPGRVVIVVEDAGSILGFAIVDDVGDRAWLEDLWVEPARFGAGIGRALWSAAVEAARGMGQPSLDFEADPNAEPFYRRMGARTVGSRSSTIDGGRVLPIMRRAV